MSARTKAGRSRRCDGTKAGRSRRCYRKNIGWAMLWLAALGAPFTVACLDRELAPLNPCVISTTEASVTLDPVDKIDLLFMVDDSLSMRGEQIRLARELPKLAGVLASGDLQWDPATGSGDGEQDFPPVRDLQVGVVSSDMGSFGAGTSSCESDVGEDGILQTSGDTSGSCASSYPSILQFCNDGDCGGGAYTDVATFANDFGCLARQGTGGCGFEQQLEATLKGLTPSDAEATGAFDGTFLRGTGHGNGQNAGFVRDDALLAVLLLTDEDDCSVRDASFFEADNPDYGGRSTLNTRCYNPGVYGEALHPVARYVDGLRALKDNPDLFVYAAITGVPPELTDGVGAECETAGDCPAGTRCQGDRCVQDLDAILDDPRMQFERQMPEDSGLAEPRPACTTPALEGADEPGKAYPARRITEVARGLEAEGSNGLVQSICQEDFAPALDAILRKLAKALGGTCLGRELNPDAQGKVSCDVVEVLPAEGEFTTCESLSHLGREPFDPPRTEDGREVCRVKQIPVSELETGGEGFCRAPDGEVGWYYDDCSQEVTETCGGDGQRIAFASGSAPKGGTTLRLECLQNIQGSGSGENVELGSPCDGSGDTCTDSNPHGQSCQGATCMVCEPQVRTCQLPCETNADCVNANLGGYVCPSDAEREELGLARRVCVNPTCGEM
ncbi:MAG: hypothetical protein ACOCUS_04395 [Polyangiales bacterium]